MERDYVEKDWHLCKLGIYSVIAAFFTLEILQYIPDSHWLFQTIGYLGAAFALTFGLAGTYLYFFRIRPRTSLEKVLNLFFVFGAYIIVYRSIPTDRIDKRVLSVVFWLSIVLVLTL